MNWLKKTICKYLNIKACKCADKIQVKEVDNTVKAEHCSKHTRFRKSCIDCIIIIKGDRKNG
jgi:hypothetical protein